jgi:flagellar operon protein
MPTQIGNGSAPPALPAERKVTGRQESVGRGKGPSFEQVLEQTCNRQAPSRLRFSAHATARMQAHGIQLDREGLARLEVAVEQARAKGIRDSLIVTDSSNFIVNVPNSAVVTIVPRGAPQGDVFTQIDGAVIV